MRMQTVGCAMLAAIRGKKGYACGRRVGGHALTRRENGSFASATFVLTMYHTVLLSINSLSSY